MASDALRKLFISYSRDNIAIIDALNADLVQRGLHTWIDRSSIQGGDDFMDRIAQGVSWCDAMIVALSPAATASRWVEDEWKMARRENKGIVPIILEECEVPKWLGGLQWVDFRQDYNAGLANLLLVLLGEEVDIPVGDASGDARSIDSSRRALSDLFVNANIAEHNNDLERASIYYQRVIDQAPPDLQVLARNRLQQMQPALDIQRAELLRQQAQAAQSEGAWGQVTATLRALSRISEVQEPDLSVRIRIAEHNANEAYSDLYSAAVKFASQGSNDHAIESLKQLWRGAPFYGDPAGIAPTLNLPTPPTYEQAKIQYAAEFARALEDARVALARAQAAKDAATKSFSEMPQDWQVRSVGSSVTVALATATSAIGQAQHALAAIEAISQANDLETLTENARSAREKAQRASLAADRAEQVRDQVKAAIAAEGERLVEEAREAEASRVRNLHQQVTEKQAEVTRLAERCDLLKEPALKHVQSLTGKRKDQAEALYQKLLEQTDLMRQYVTQMDELSERISHNSADKLADVVSEAIACANLSTSSANNAAKLADDIDEAARLARVDGKLQTRAGFNRYVLGFGVGSAAFALAVLIIMTGYLTYGISSSPSATSIAVAIMCMLGYVLGYRRALGLTEFIITCGISSLVVAASIYMPGSLIVTITHQLSTLSILTIALMIVAGSIGFISSLNTSFEGSWGVWPGCATVGIIYISIAFFALFIVVPYNMAFNHENFTDIIGSTMVSLARYLIVGGVGYWLATSVGLWWRAFRPLPSAESASPRPKKTETEPKNTTSTTPSTSSAQ